MGLFGKGWLKSSDDDELRSRKSEIESETDWSSGSILDGDFDDESEAIEPIDEELTAVNQRGVKKWPEMN